MLGLGMGAQAASCVFLYGLPYLVPDLRHQLGLSLTAASALVAAPLIGVIVTLVAWGALADRYGERLVITAGLAIAGGALLAATRLSGALGIGVLLGCAGAGGASVNAASGRLVLGWFGAAERGLAMGARQTAQPLGTMLAAAALPAIAARSGLAGALGACGALCLAAAALVAIFAADPPRPSRAGAEPAPSPYRAPTLWRIHAASMLLVVPQFATTGFALEYLVAGRGWSAVDAGRVIAIANLAGALTRLAAGKWSDRAMSRLRPMRWLARRGGGHHGPDRARDVVALAAGRRRAARRGRPVGQHERPGVHGGRGDRGHVLGGPGARRAEHRSERGRSRDAAGHGAAHRADRLRRGLRPRGPVPARRDRRDPGPRRAPARAGPPSSTSTALARRPSSASPLEPS